MLYLFAYYVFGHIYDINNQHFIFFIVYIFFILHIFDPIIGIVLKQVGLTYI